MPVVVDMDWSLIFRGRHHPRAFFKMQQYFVRQSFIPDEHLCWPLNNCINSYYDLILFTSGCVYCFLVNPALQGEFGVLTHKQELVDCYHEWSIWGYLVETKSKYEQAYV